jgi:cytochrome b
MDGPAARPAGWAWDPVVRITHWSIAAAVLLNGMLTEGGALVHLWIGYAAFAMLGLRLVWGFIGPEEARFAAFTPSLRAARTHVADLLAGRHRTYRSHDPLGSLMIYALWGTLVVVVASGVAMQPDPLPDGEAGASFTQR